MTEKRRRRLSSRCHSTRHPRRERRRGQRVGRITRFIFPSEIEAEMKNGGELHPGERKVPDATASRMIPTVIHACQVGRIALRRRGGRPERSAPDKGRWQAKERALERTVFMAL